MFTKMNFLLFDLISYFGIVLIFTAYSLNKLTKLNLTIYSILNMMGGVLLTIYAIHISNIVFVVLNFVWSVIALVDLFYIIERKFKSGNI